MCKRGVARSNILSSIYNSIFFLNQCSERRDHLPVGAVVVNANVAVVAVIAII